MQKFLKQVTVKPVTITTMTGKAILFLNNAKKVGE
jgi:hypothetical protein